MVTNVGKIWSAKAMEAAMAMKTTLPTNAVTTTDKRRHLKQGQRCECPADLTTAEHLKRYYQSIISTLTFEPLMFKKYSAYT